MTAEDESTRLLPPFHPSSKLRYLHRILVICVLFTRNLRLPLTFPPTDHVDGFGQSVPDPLNRN